MWALERLRNNNPSFVRLDVSNGGDDRAPGEEGEPHPYDLGSLNTDEIQLLGAALQVNTTVTFLNLIPVDLEEDQFRPISEALQVNTTITRLRLFNQGAQGAGAWSFISSLRGNASITDLCLSWCKITGNYGRCIADAIGPKGTGVGIEFTDAINPNLKILNINGLALPTEEFRLVMDALNPSLVEFKLACCKIGTGGAQYLSEYLRTNSALQTLDLSSNQIGPVGVRAIVAAFGSTLTSLNISDNGMGAETMEYLCAALRTNFALTSLDISSNHVRDAGIGSLCEILRTNSVLVDLNVSETDLTDVGVEGIVEMLRVNPTLTSLDLSSNEIGAVGAQALGDVLQVNSTLTTLNLGWNNLNDASIRHLCDALRVNTTLTNMDFGDEFETYQTHEIMQYIADTIRINFTLTSFVCCRNYIDPIGIQYIVEALRSNFTLTAIGYMTRYLKLQVDEILVRNKCNAHLKDAGLVYTVYKYLGQLE